MKKFAQAAMLALLTASFMIPTGVEAANSQQTSNTVAPSTTTQVANFSNLGKSNKTSSSGYFNVNTEGYVTVNVNQTHNSDTAYVLYAIVKDRPDGTTTSYGSANLRKASC
ncbi:hypothetical protein [Brevibacillus sp. Leaf182]|uniref:hypothetical protein n=1 Tax=Brevibacillus sp. Leaf182 TaxID=1736290 RepID=UPI0006F4EE07|nr:hypothetical protein [Brevibacillus sp. Leaf182]